MRYPFAPPYVRAVLVEGPTFEPLTLVQAKLRAGQDWADGDPRDAMLQGFISAARSKVELDTGLALPAQTIDLLIDYTPSYAQPVALPWYALPVADVVAVRWLDEAGAVLDLPVADYNTEGGETLWLTLDGAAPTTGRAIAVRVVVGYLTAAEIPPLLVYAVGLLTAHYMTTGRDLVQVGTIVAETPKGYDDAIQPFKRVSLG